jgi:membrane protein DedA with SNARE-associated domain
MGDGGPDGLVGQLWEWVKIYPDPVMLGMLILCGVGLPMPEEPILLLAGVVAVENTAVEGGGDHVGLHALLLRFTVVCSVGILIGDLLCFYLGRRIGRDIFKWRWVGKIATRPRRVRAERWFQEYGAWAIFLARFLAGVRLVMYFSAGMSRRVSVWKFVAMDFLGTLVSVPTSIWLAALAWEKLRDFDKAREKLGSFHKVLLAALVVGIVAWFLMARKRRRHDSGHGGRRAPDAPPPPSAPAAPPPAAPPAAEGP